MKPEIIVHVARHGHILSYESDVALTPAGRQAARDAGHQLAESVENDEVISFLYGPARRARETAWGIYQRLCEIFPAGCGAGTNISAPVSHPDLRNFGMKNLRDRLQDPIRPLYDAARAEHEANPSPESASRLEYHRNFWDSTDPIGYWLTHPGPYAEYPDDVALRIRHVIDRLLAEPPLPPARRRRVICASHSATMRAYLRHVLGADPGEPHFCESLSVSRAENGAVRVVFRDQSAVLAVQPVG